MAVSSLVQARDVMTHQDQRRWLILLFSKLSLKSVFGNLSQRVTVTQSWSHWFRIKVRT